MSTRLPEPIDNSNLSYAWAEAFLRTMKWSRRDLTPLLISVDGFSDGQPSEDLIIRQSLDSALRQTDNFSCSDSARIIFPYGEWKRQGCPGIADFSSWYLDSYLPRLKARAKGSRRHTYFERMIAYSGVKVVQNKVSVEYVNQLLHIINDWRRERSRPKRPRQSALQVSCFDPVKDHTGSALLGFPCLQQVSFGHDGGDGLAVNAYYPTQYIFSRAYGNYLGLIHLGSFMAAELGLELKRLNCYVARPELGGLPKGQLKDLAYKIEMALSAQPYYQRRSQLTSAAAEGH